MAGRGGREQGRSNMTFNLENLGIGRGEALPPGSLHPSPLFPPMTGQPVPLQTGEEVDYMLALKQELRAATKNLPYYIRQDAPRRGTRITDNVLRYSDKYHRAGFAESIMDWRPDWSRLPNELCIKVRKSQRKGVVPQLNKTKINIIGKEELLSKLEILEKKDEIVNSEDEEKEKTNEEEEQEQEQEEELDEDDLEEETDYIMSYFDNGEDFGVDSDDNMDEATY